MAQASAGNILGEATAETDSRMLSLAFYKSRNYVVLIDGNDFRSVVGRRGAGKSALFIQVSREIRKNKKSETILLSERPSEEKNAALQEELKKYSSSYADARSISRQLWRVQILSTAVETILKHYKADRLGEYQVYLQDFKQKHSSLFLHEGLARSLEALRIVNRIHPGVNARAILEVIADHFEIGNLQNAVIQGVLRVLKKKVVFLYDGLDEGWLPDHTATGVLGGLAKVASEFREQDVGIHCVLFIRDNMLRALAHLDPDYSRNIEGSTLRLQWDETTLLALVALRIRAHFNWADEESDQKVWSRFAQRNLEGMAGFRRVLKLTLYRPRDLINLLNGAFQVAARGSRDRIIDSDVEAAATFISEKRLRDLYNEYEHVLPGLPLFAEAFRAGPAKRSYGDAKELLQRVVDAGQSGLVSRDFALLPSGADAFNALYSVGFVGVEGPGMDAIKFCHDGSNTDIVHTPNNQMAVVHPCFWKALNLGDEISQDEVIVRLDDEDDVASGGQAKAVMKETRFRKLGQIVEELPRIPVGTDGARAFEQWVFQTLRYLFANDLSNLELHANLGDVVQRDVIGSLNSDTGIWARIARSYGVSQAVFECKNFEEMKQTEFRQAWDYATGPYGKLIFIVTRSSEEKKITNRERTLVHDGYARHDKMVILLPAMLLHRALRKMRGSKEQRDDYVRKVLTERLDTYERSYISSKAVRSDNLGLE